MRVDMKKRGYNQFDFPLDGKRGYLVDSKYPPEERRGFDPFECGTSCRDDFYYLTESGHEYGNYYRTDSILTDPSGRGRDLYWMEHCDGDGHRWGDEPFAVELVRVKHGRYMIEGFNRVEENGLS